MVDVVEVTLANCGVFMHWHAKDTKFALVRYKEAYGIPSHSSKDTHTYSPQCIPF